MFSTSLLIARAMSDRGLTGPPDDKVVLVGNPGVGKSTIFQYFKTGQFVQEEKLNHHDKAEFTKEWTVGGVKRSVREACWIFSDSSYCLSYSADHAL